LASPSSDERTEAKVEELDRLIAELQGRRRDLLQAVKSTRAVPASAGTEEAKAKPASSPEAPVRAPTAASSPRARSSLEKELDELPWKSFKKKEGEWAFLRDREGRLVDELQSSKEFVDRLRKEGEVVVGKYRYQVSEDKFLNRYYAGGSKG
jgi:hypothetical protein